MSFEIPQTSSLENVAEAEKEPKEKYLYERLGEAQNRLSEYFPNFYRDIPTKLNYQDNSEDLKINYYFEDGDFNIAIKTPENLIDKSVEDLSRTEDRFLVFQDVAKDEIISKKTQDLFFLQHEYIHGINQVLINENRPDITQIIREKRKEFEKADKKRKKELRQEEQNNSILPVLGESLPVSFERITVEKILQDEKLQKEEKENAKKFWGKHKESLLKKKLENDPKSKYSELDERMICYKIHQELGENGIVEFIKGFDFEKLSKVKRYADPEKRILSDEYKKLLEMGGARFVKEFMST